MIVDGQLLLENQISNIVTKISKGIVMVRRKMKAFVAKSSNVQYRHLVCDHGDDGFIIQ
jgi:hypothetical protein